MRAPFQILAIPYRMINGMPYYCVFRRADHDQWQFIAGGGEDEESPTEAAKRECYEEGGVTMDTILPLKSMCYIPAEIFPRRHLYHWPKDTFVIPEYAFCFECKQDIKLSHEHTDFAWIPYEEARERLQWDSNRTALYELNCRIKEKSK